MREGEQVDYRRLGKITAQQFQQALERFGLGDFVLAESVPGGLFGQNVFVTSTQGRFVLRGKPHYDWQFPTERFFTEQLHAKTCVPVAYPYLLDLSTDIFGWSYAFMPRLPGSTAKEISADPQYGMQDHLEIAHALARTLIEAQALTWEYAGKYNHATGAVDRFEQGYREWVVANIWRKARASQQVNDHITDADFRWIDSIIAQARPFFDTPFQPVIVFADYGKHNALFEKTPSGWQTSAVFDLMTAHVGDGLADLSVTTVSYLKENPTLSEAFIAEYLRQRTMSQGFAALQRLYMLDLRLSFWEYWQRVNGHVLEDPTGSMDFQTFAAASIAFWDRYE